MPPLCSLEDGQSRRSTRCSESKAAAALSLLTDDRVEQALATWCPSGESLDPLDENSRSLEAHPPQAEVSYCPEAESLGRAGRAPGLARAGATPAQRASRSSQARIGVSTSMMRLWVVRWAAARRNDRRGRVVRRGAPMSSAPSRGYFHHQKSSRGSATTDTYDCNPMPRRVDVRCRRARRARISISRRQRVLGSSQATTLK
jgi:hypothetical protein